LMMQTLRSHVLVLSTLPLILNILVTPIVIISAVSLPEFLKSSTYYVYTHGFILWSIYHVSLTGLTLKFFKAENESVRGIIGPLRGELRLTILIIAMLLGLSILLFQIIEPYVTDLIYGPEAWKQFLNEYKRVPLALAVYGIAVTSLTAGMCEEIVWRGYLQTRLNVYYMARFLRQYCFKRCYSVFGTAYQYTRFSRRFSALYME
jgi:membrane protease YdiL (CAAX protease family)